MFDVLNEKGCIILETKVCVAQIKTRLLWCPVCMYVCGVHTDENKVVELEKEY